MFEINQQPATSNRFPANQNTVFLGGQPIRAQYFLGGQSD